MDLPEIVTHYVRKPEFLRWCDNPEEPRDWTGVARFLDLTADDRQVDPVERLKEIRAATQAAFDWCKARDTLLFTSTGSRILISDLANLLDFLLALTYRFPGALDPKKGETDDEDKRQDKDEEPFWDWD